MKLPDWSKAALGIPADVMAFVRVGSASPDLVERATELLAIVERGGTVTLMGSEGAPPRYQLRIATQGGGRYGNGQGDTLEACIGAALTAMDQQ